jgi:cyclophilin family peptidyl-prolyl cis-trans isomerase
MAASPMAGHRDDRHPGLPVSLAGIADGRHFRGILRAADRYGAATRRGRLARFAEPARRVRPEGAMRPRLLAAAALVLLPSPLLAPLSAQARNSAPPAPVVVLTTAKGVIEIETFPGEAPKSVARFVELAKSGFYRGTRFHWVEPGVAQVGDQLSRDMTKRDLWGTGGSGYKMSARPIGVAELSMRRFERGIVGLAYRSGQKPELADSQIFILTHPNPALNGKYAVIGRVIKGMEVVDKIVVTDMIKNVSVR